MTAVEKLMPEVQQAIAEKGYKVYAYMNDGLVHQFDMWPLILKGGIFEPLKDARVFKSTLTVMNETIAWDVSGNRNERRCIDIDPFEVYASPTVKDPLEKE